MLKEILQGIVEDDKRTASILSSIRGMMKLERREKEKTDINALIIEISDIFRTGTANYDIELIVRLPDRPVYIFADGIQMQQVIMNLLSNATHSVLASETGEKKIVMSGLPENGNITLSVRDYGRGIDPEIIGRLFKPFVTSKNDGMGIGLAISKAIIEDHQGTIRAENMPDGGAQFSFSLKIYDHDA
ncbi:MAG: GHKL domain-containing protein [Bacteroidales bacterium]|nr:GHKL domain-containing protein [Bacteroidales bacterium]